MISRRNKQKDPTAIESEAGDSETMEHLKASEAGYNQLLSPWEPHIMTAQSLLVWESPEHSVVLLIVANVFFWLATRLDVYYLIGLVGFFGVFLDMWWAKIWPEIRVPPPPEEQEGWTPVHPKLLSVPELSHYCAKISVSGTNSVHWAIQLRRQSHAKFFLLMSGVFSSLAFLGNRVPGILICYIAVMSCLVIPALVYHNIIQEMYAKVEPYIFKFEKTFNIKRKKRSRRVKKKSGLEDSTVSMTSQGSDSEEDILNEFVPSPHPSLLSTLHRAAKIGRESDGDHTPSHLTPDNISRGPSRDHSDNESHEDNLNFSQDLSELPSFDDTRLLEDSSNPSLGGATCSLTALGSIPDYDELEKEFKSDPDLDLDETLTAPDPLESKPSSSSLSTQSGYGMDFKETHFKESSESGGDEGVALEEEDDNLALGLQSMPDVEDVLDHEQRESAEKRATLLGHAQARIASDVMARTMSEYMTSTMSGLSQLWTAAAGAMAEHGGQEGEGAPGDGPRQRPLSDSVDSDTLVAGFEFLDFAGSPELNVMDTDNDVDSNVATNSADDGNVANKKSTKTDP